MIGAAWAHQHSDVFVPFGQAFVAGITDLGMYPASLWGALMLPWCLTNWSIDAPRSAT